MNAQRRPGGLTALAVFNFIFGGLSAISALGLVGLILLVSSSGVLPDNLPPEQQARFDAIIEMGRSVFMILTAISALSAVLLIVSGIGYLKLKKFLGRTLGNVTAILSIATSVTSALWMAPQLGGGFNLGTLIGLIYPVLTLFFLNVTFKEDFVN